MDNLIPVLLIAFIIFIVVRKMVPPKGINQISTAELKGHLKQKKKEMHFIDVRTKMEYQNRGLKEFQNIPLNELKSKLNTLNKEKEVVVICQSGSRSLQAARILKKNGFNVTNVRGGMMMYR